jgi:nitroreductase
LLLRENHIIEKGLSMRNPRRGFGQAKVLMLLTHLDEYVSKFISIDKDFLLYPFSTISHYIAYTKETGIDISNIERVFDELLAKANCLRSSFSSNVGVRMESRVHIHAICNNSFEALLYSRHSVRYFSQEMPSKDVLLHALQIAQQTPSACNRQAWHTHIFTGANNHALLKEQGGCKGFENEISCSILVTADMNAFLSYEIHQVYIDGGLYAMNLINALHSLGLGTIPLSCGFYSSKLQSIKCLFNIPDNEVLILIIGVGILPDEFNVAISNRKNISCTNSYH